MESQKKVKTVTLLSNITLEGNEADTQAVGNRIILDTYVSDQLNLVCKYTTGASETNNTCHVKVWGYIGTYSATNNFPYADTADTSIANDTTNWIQIGKFDTVGDTVIFTPSVFDVVGAAGGTTYNAHFAFGITWPKIRISAYESGVASKKGRLTCVALIQ
jgi:hypothetical protein